jgi:hypothetical protein
MGQFHDDNTWTNRLQWPINALNPQWAVAWHSQVGPVWFQLAVWLLSKGIRLAPTMNSLPLPDKLELAHGSLRNLLYKPSYGPISYATIIEQIAHNSLSSPQWATAWDSCLGPLYLKLAGSLPSTIIRAHAMNSLLLPNKFELAHHS